MTKAAGKSFKTTMEAVQESAKSAAKVVGEAAEKVKGSGKSTADNDHDEL